MRKFKYANLFLILLIMSNVLSACTPSWKSIAQQRDTLSSRLELERTRMDKASEEVDAWSGKFPAHYTTESQPYLDSANEALNNIGVNEGWMAELNMAIEKKDRKTATDRLDQIKGGLDTIGVYTLRIIGPPGSTGQGLYRELEQKVERLHKGFDANDGKDLKTEVNNLMTPTWNYIDNAEQFKLCGSNVDMSYASAWNLYNAGVTNFSQAERQAEMRVLMPDGTMVVDEPAVSDWLVGAYSSLTGAMGEAAGAKTEHQSAVDAISYAKSSKGSADLALINIFADYYSTVSSEHSSGVSDLNSAQNFCESEDFASAVTYANNAKTHFESAVYWSTQEEPDPVVVESDDDDSSVWPDSGGSDSYDDGGYDSYDDGGYDSYDDGGYDSYDDGGY